ncbi:MAG: hypothetical protein HY909_24890 [Deltaproteobacteria bacterium]|nr:hypothetical protein [Deltaproteobacteria bacterium]
MRSLGPMVAAGLWLLPGWALGQTPTRLDENLVTPRTMALGGGGYAVAASTSGVYANPAALSLARLYHMDSSVLFDPTVRRWSFGGAVADSTRVVSAGFGYTFSTIGEGDRSSHDLRLALSALLTEGVSLGATLRWMDHSGTATTNTQRGTAYSGFTLDAGLAVRVARFLSLGGVALNITDPSTSLAPLSFGGGVGLHLSDSFSLVGDAVWDLRSWDLIRPRFSGGVELLMNRVPLRLGYAYDDGRMSHALSGGIGYLEQAYGVELSFRQALDPAPQTTVLLSLRYFYRPNGV